MMSKKEYRAALEELELSQGRAAWIFGGKSGRSGRRWANEGAPYAVALVITLMQEFELTPEHIEAIGARFRKKAA
jgi:hypothetical protein